MPTPTPSDASLFSGPSGPSAASWPMSNPIDDDDMSNDDDAGVADLDVDADVNDDAAPPAVGDAADKDEATPPGDAPPTVRLPLPRGYFQWPPPLPKRTTSSGKGIDEEYKDDDEDPWKIDSFLRTVRDENVLVVGVFGKTSVGGTGSGHAHSKGRLFDQLIQAEVFATGRGQRVRREERAGRKEDSYIEGFYDYRSKRIFLNLMQLGDTASLMDECCRAKKEIEEKGYHPFHASNALSGSSMLLFLFHVCHLVIHHHPSYTFDISYVNLFQALEDVRLLLQPLLSDSFGNATSNKKLPDEWIHDGRVCTPKILFYFASAPAVFRGSKGLTEVISTTKKNPPAKHHRHPPLKKLEFSIEDQISRIFRKARILTHSGPCLFQLPQRDEFVYVENGSDASRNGDFMADAMNKMYKTLANPSDPEVMSSPFSPYFHQQQAEESRVDRCFSRFLNQHLEQIDARTKDDSLRPARASRWFQFASQLLPRFLRLRPEDPASGADGADAVASPPDDADPDADLAESRSRSRSRRALERLSAHANIDLKFSESRCAKALPQAFAAYKEGLPQHYTEEYHNAKLLQAMSLYSLSARGPASGQFGERLAEQCTLYWQTGARQMCEEVSLTGKGCTNRRHWLPGQKQKQQQKEEKGAKKPQLPTLPHLSGRTYLCACNCGRSQSQRNDPFSLYEANYNFFAEVEVDCCHDLEHANFPVYQQPAEDGGEGAFGNALPVESPLKGETDELTLGLRKTLEDLKITREKEGKKRETLESLADLANNKALSRQSSTLVSIPYMLTKTTPSGRLPSFPSWSLVHLGSSFLYSHSAGVSQPGFLPGSKFLLPWTIPLKKITYGELREDWPILAEHAEKKPNFDPQGTAESMGVTVKVFLGFEYECTRGHRFMAAGPDKALGSASASSSAGARSDAAGRMVTSDMPLYMGCPCRSSSSSSSSSSSNSSSSSSLLPAQLMRVHVVTPKAPLHVTLLPQVQPCPDGPVFHCGWTKPIKLPFNSCWVLRLPYIFCGEDGAHLPPKDLPELSYGKLLKGVIAINEDFERNPTI